MPVRWWWVKDGHPERFGPHPLPSHRAKSCDCSDQEDMAEVTLPRPALRERSFPFLSFETLFPGVLICCRTILTLLSCCAEDQGRFAEMPRGQRDARSALGYARRPAQAPDTCVEEPSVLQPWPPSDTDTRETLSQSCPARLAHTQNRERQ